MSLIPNGAIVEGEIVCRVVAHGAWADTLLNRKSRVLTINYIFWPSGKCSIDQIEH